MQNEIEIMRVLRVPPMGKLMISFNNQRYASIDEISEANIRQLFKTAIGELITFAGGYQKLVDAGVAPPLSALQSAAGRSLSEAEEAEQFIDRLEREKEELKSAGPKSPPTLLANMRRRPATSQTSANKMLSLVEQVDAILQRHLLADPELAGRKIHLVQDAKGGLIIDVDGKRYERPRDIENPQIQMMIKQALKEWEST
jgi:hypothetical protein